MSLMDMVGLNDTARQTVEQFGDKCKDTIDHARAMVEGFFRSDDGKKLTEKVDSIDSSVKDLNRNMEDLNKFTRESLDSAKKLSTRVDSAFEKGMGELSASFIISFASVFVGKATRGLMLRAGCKASSLEIEMAVATMSTLAAYSCKSLKVVSKMGSGSLSFQLLFSIVSSGLEFALCQNRWKVKEAIAFIAALRACGELLDTSEWMEKGAKIIGTFVGAGSAAMAATWIVDACFNCYDGKDHLMKELPAPA